MDDTKKTSVPSDLDTFLPEGENTKFVVEEALPLLQALHCIGSQELRQSVFEFVRKIAEAQD